MNIIFIDSETTGLPRDWKAPASDLDNWPRCLQLAWQVTDHYGNVLEDHKYLIRPDQWEVPKEKFWIDHGFSTEKSLAEGKPMPAVLDHMLHHIGAGEVQIICAHNISFDLKIVGAEMIRYGKKTKPGLKQICTMQHGTELCKLPGKYGKGYKFPKLQELYQYLFNKDFDNAHDAGGDVTACRLCFFEMVNRSVITLPLPYGAGAGSGI